MKRVHACVRACARVQESNKYALPHEVADGLLELLDRERAGAPDVLQAR